MSSSSWLVPVRGRAHVCNSQIRLSRIERHRHFALDMVDDSLMIDQKNDFYSMSIKWIFTIDCMPLRQWPLSQFVSSAHIRWLNVTVSARSLARSLTRQPVCMASNKLNWKYRLSVDSTKLNVDSTKIPFLTFF